MKFKLSEYSGNQEKQSKHYGTDSHVGTEQTRRDRSSFEKQVAKQAWCMCVLHWDSSLADAHLYISEVLTMHPNHM